MADPFINPLDTSPLGRPTPTSQHRSIVPSVLSGEKSLFQQVLESRVQQEPTPIQMPKPIEQSFNNQIRSTHEPRAGLNLLAPASSNEPTLLELNADPSASHMSPSSKTAGEVIAPTQPKVESPAPEKEIVAPAVPSNPPPAPNTLREILEKSSKKEETENSSASSQETKTEKQSETESEKEAVLDHDETEPADDLYTIQKGDTLSQIIADRMRQAGTKFRTADLYQLVRIVADANQITNSNIIFAGQTIDLSPIHTFEPVIAKQRGQQTAWVQDALPPVQGAISSTFGMRTHPIFNEPRFHHGIDIQVESGTLVNAVKPGMITFSGYQPGYGQLVEVDHGDGTRTLYAHLSERMVQVGDSVSEDRPIARSGDTGRTTGPHLHFEIRENGRPVDPLQFFSAGEIEQNVVHLARTETSDNPAPSDRSST